MRRKIVRVFLLIFLVFCFYLHFSSTLGHAAAPKASTTEEKLSEAEKEPTEEKFDVGGMIIEEVLDGYEWHFCTLPNGHHVAISLPIIAISEGSLYCFSSSRLHEDGSYKGFYFSKEGGSHSKLRKIDEHGTAVKLYDFSITRNVAGVMVSVILLIVIFISVAKQSKRNEGRAPTGLQNALEPFILFVRETAISNIGKKHYEKFMPYLLTLFFFIALNNLFGRVPMYPNTTGNISIALVMALFTFIITNINGSRHYWKEVFNPGVPWWLKFPLPIMPLIEFVSIFTKPFVLTVRLFANITGGHIVSASIIFLIFLFGKIFGAGAAYGTGVVAVLFSLFLSFIEILVAFIQAYVFTLLSAIYFGAAVEDGD